jgi:Protein of unknown function (DUF3035)
MSRADFPFARRTVKLAAVLSAGLALIGCQSIREATGVAKLPPDEFTVLTKAPLVLPPDYNLRPPQPGIASRNELNAEEQGRAALFANPQDQLQALGTTYSDGEKLLLQRSGALGADPNIRRAVTSDVGLEDQGPAFAQTVLYPQTAAAATPTPAQGTTAPGTALSAESVLYPQAAGPTAAPTPEAAPGADTPAEPAATAAQAQEKRPWWKWTF